MKTINVTHAAYEGDDFPEAAYYSQYVASALAEQFPGAAVEVSEGLETQVFVDGAPDEGIRQQVSVDLWEAFCADGYRQFSA